MNLFFKENFQAIIYFLSVEFLCQTLPLFYVEQLLNFLSEQLQHSRHFAFYLSWIYHLLMYHTNNLKPNATKILSTLCNLEKNLSTKNEHLGKMSVLNYALLLTYTCTHHGFNSFIFSVENNIFTIDYLSTIASIPKIGESNDEMEISSNETKKRKSSDRLSNSISEE